MRETTELALVLALLGVLPGAARVEAAPVPTRLHPVATLATADREPPAGFLPLSDGSLVLLDAARHRLLRYRQGELVEASPLVGREFEPTRARLVDLVEERPGNLLVLDAGQGTVWRTDLSGEISGRFGMLVAPTQIGRGADGRIWVVDTGTGRVVGFRRGRAEKSLPLEGWTSPFATRDGSLPVVDWTADGAARVDLLGEDGRQPLTRLVAPEGLELIEARVVGVHRDRLWMQVILGRPGQGQPAASRLVQVAAAGRRRGARRVYEVPTLLNHCLDCGPDLRVGPDGAPWLYTERTGKYGIFRLGEEVSR